MLCISPVDGHRCGHCMACRLEKQREKRIRICHEAEYFKKKCFVTLTYDPAKHDNTNLVKSDLQKFIKRVRRQMEPNPIKYFACGEYGTEGATHHAHYHVIFFGLDVYDKIFRKREWCPKQNSWRVECSCWNYGFVMVGVFNEKRADYVAKYCLKKVTGAMAKDYYQGRQPEFALFSQGLGLAWLKDHKKLVLQDGFIRVRNSRVPLPRYYEQKLFPERDRMCNQAIDYRWNKAEQTFDAYEKEKKASRATTEEGFQKYRDECRKMIARRFAMKEQRKHEYKG